MNPQSVITLGQQGMEVMLVVGAPLLLAALVTGLLVSIFQAATQINEATLSFLPKFLAVLATLVIAGPWMIQLLVDYIQRLYTSIPTIIG
jgi:flagellar biosynthesis protein FliQ